MALMTSLLLSSCVIWNPFPGIEPYSIVISNENPSRHQEVILSISRSLQNDEIIEWYHNGIIIGKSEELAWSFDAGTHNIKARITSQENNDQLMSQMAVQVPDHFFFYFIDYGINIVDQRNSMATIRIECIDSTMQKTLCDSTKLSNLVIEIESPNNQRNTVELYPSSDYEVWQASINLDQYDEMAYKVHVRFNNGQGTIFRLNNFFHFSGQHYRTCITDSDCLLGYSETNFHYCEDNTCRLRDTSYNVGVVYVHTDQYNYNKDWKQDLEPVFNRVNSYIKELTDNKIEFSYEIIGSHQTDLMCWNPAILAAEYTILGEKHYIKYPQSDFAIAGGTSFEATDVQLHDSCQNCILEKVKRTEIEFGTETCTFVDETVSHGACFENSDYRPFRCNGKTGESVADCETCGCNQPFICDSYSGECLNPEPGIAKYDLKGICDETKALYADTFWTNINLLRSEISNKYDIKKEDYDEIVLIYGKLGPIHLESERDNYHLCHSASGHILGWASLDFAENGLYRPYIVDCSEYKNMQTGYYIPAGGHKTIIHEILHRFGTVDIYETHTMFGYSTDYYRALASKLDKDYRKSVMGEAEIDCMQGDEWWYGEPKCSIDELNEVYLDVLNRRLIGLITPKNK